MMAVVIMIQALGRWASLCAPHNLHQHPSHMQNYMLLDFSKPKEPWLASTSQETATAWWLLSCYAEFPWWRDGISFFVCDGKVHQNKQIFIDVKEQITFVWVMLSSGDKIKLSQGILTESLQWSCVKHSWHTISSQPSGLDRAKLLDSCTVLDYYWTAQTMCAVITASECYFQLINWSNFYYPREGQATIIWCDFSTR